MITFARRLHVSDGFRTDWPRFARWHYRSHQIGLVRSVCVLWDGCPDARPRTEPLFPDAPPDPNDDGNDLPPRPIGIAVFVSPPMSLAGRNRFFGRRGRWGRLEMRMMNRQLILLQRLVLHPTYRGAGLAVPFLKTACDRTGVRWVETLTGLGETHPVFERAGFVRVGRVRLAAAKRTRAGHSALFGGRDVTPETFAKSRHTSPVYFVRRGGAAGRRTREEGQGTRETAFRSRRPIAETEN